MRSPPAELAVFTGRPAFSEPLHVGRPNVGDTERVLERIRGALDRRWLTNNGPLVREVEERIGKLTGVRRCIAVGNATSGLQLVARALELKGEVIVPSWTFVGTAQALSWIGLEPVFCEIDAETHNLDPAAVAAAITPRTSAILGVHLWGRSCDVEGLAAVAEVHGGGALMSSQIARKVVTAFRQPETMESAKARLSSLCLERLSTASCGAR